MFSIGVYSADGRRLAFATGEKQANLLYEGVYQEGDEIRFESETAYARVRVDAAVDEARVYLPEKRFTYRLPLSGDNRKVYAPGAFGGETHLLSIRVDEESGTYNLACNPADQRGEVSAYPHATANVETRNESVFCARNVIDGLTIAAGHGIWPYESWGIGARQDAYLTVDFGREVELDRGAIPSGGLPARRMVDFRRDRDRRRRALRVPAGGHGRAADHRAGRRSRENADSEGACEVRHAVGVPVASAADGVRPQCDRNRVICRCFASFRLQNRKNAL